MFENQVERRTFCKHRTSSTNKTHRRNRRLQRRDLVKCPIDDNCTRSASDSSRKYRGRRHASLDPVTDCRQTASMRRSLSSPNPKHRTSRDACTMRIRSRSCSRHLGIEKITDNIYRNFIRLNEVGIQCNRSSATQNMYRNTDPLLASDERRNKPVLVRTINPSPVHRRLRVK